LALGLRQRVGAGVEQAGQSLPAPGEVTVEVDPVRVAARVGRAAVRVENRDDPEIESAWGARLQPAGDRYAGRLVPVDAADDEFPVGAARTSHLDGDDRPAVDGAPEDDSTRRRSDGRGVAGGDDQCYQHHAAD